MKLLLENWREFVKQEVEEFLPHGEVRAVEKIGSSVLPPEEQAKQDLEKYGYVRDEDDRDIDIEVQIAHITNEEAEEWAFSREAQELEDYYNYDVQLRIVENWRKFINEDSNYNVSEAKDINKIAKAIIVKDNKALILLRAGSEKNADKWDLPGGHLNEGEELMEGLLREVYEETGLTLSEPIESLYTKENTSFFKAGMPQEDIKLSHEHTEYKFISVDEIPENISSRFVKAIKASL